MPSFRDQSTRLMIRLAKHGCTNRPFYHVVVIPNRKPRNGRIVEQIGTFDPMPNTHNERLFSLSVNRFNHYFTRGAGVSKPVQKLLGILGYFPIHPTTRLEAYRNEKKKDETQSADWSQ